VAACRLFDGYFNRWFADPIYRGAYPEDMVASYIAAGHLPAEEPTYIQAGDLQTIATPIDFLGVNYYTRGVISGVDAIEHANEPLTGRGTPVLDRTEMGWEVYPAGLYNLLTRLHADYRP